MPSSISNSDGNASDRFPWLRVFVAVALLSLAFTALMEVDLAWLGYQPTVQDSPERWAKERARASRLGDRALILIGNSRFQLGLDLDKLRSETNLEPIQLAIDGTSFVPVLKGLADDPSITGPILVDYSSGAVEESGVPGRTEAEIYERAYRRELSRNPNDYSLIRIESKLTEIVHENLRSYADGATPLMSLLTRVMPQAKSEQYLVTRTDRSRMADYHIGSISHRYYFRVARTLGMEKSIDLAAPNVERILRSKIDAIKPHSISNFMVGTHRVLEMKASIEARGGKVIFIEMPTSGMVREIEGRTFPREIFLKAFEREIGTTAISAIDDPDLQKFNCPDGSHLDFRDRAKFTEKLVHALETRGLSMRADHLDPQ